MLLIYQGGQDLPSFQVWLVDQRSSVDIESVKQVNLQWNFLRHRFYLVDTAESPHQILEWNRSTILSNSDHFSFDEILGGFDLGLGEGDNFSYAVCNVCKSSAVDPDFIVGLMDLNPGTVELVFKCASIRVFLEDGIQCLGHLGEHWLHRNENADTDPLQFPWTLSYGDLRNISNVAV